MICRVILLSTLSLGASVLFGCADTLSIQTSSHRVPNGETVRRVAVVDFAGESGQGIADILTMQLQRSGYDVVERQYLSDLMRGAVKPVQEGQTSATFTERLSKIGRLLNADAVITGDIVTHQPPRYERVSADKLKYEAAICELVARAFDVRTREVFWTMQINVTASARTGDQLKILDYLNEACAELVTSFADPNYQEGSRTLKGKDITARRGQRNRG